ncbi:MULTISPECIES: DUF2764 family protein [Petrimonas]|jgi:hypothetical protein|uniref:DUF2764 domain-containing protein n=1 Tax=Petrimonas mucosa TaxID=1642646 RepID=A0A1G4G7D3_9BACT|nr:MULTISPECIES: DUF2764 family protein [Petrimonas]MDD3560672.1 DUF2764 family protein [Petrimonas mucosa]SCM58006.1 putative protein {ECO:0000313/EMBL:CEA16368,1} [Petrimonas mucosa]SFU52198.1 Protein of unknown function [Porphyromonadaceae bacterium KHP3R9]HHT30135.1 DUF2764 family protein [Petrimonas mucosa]
MLFKHQYYCFIAGLPDFSFDSMKLPFTVEEFKEMLDGELKPDDNRLLSKYFLKYDNDNLLQLLKNKDSELNPMGSISREEIQETIGRIREDLPLKNRNIPAFYEEFIRTWLNEEAQDENRLWEDLISSLYMDYGIEVKNSLMSRWFELNLNIGNLLSAIYARKYGMDVTRVVVGNNQVARLIRENANARDFGLSQELEIFDTVVRISEESDIYERERKMDKFRWDWLEENTVFDYFNIEYIFAYLCKLQILERWVKLNAEEGERIFRGLIAGLKSEVKMPEE